MAKTPWSFGPSECNRVKSLSFIFTCLFQEDSGLTESRPGTAQTVIHVDPLAVDIEDLYVKYKVRLKIVK